MSAARGVDLIDFTWRYGLAVAVTVAAVALRLAMPEVLGVSLYLVFYPAVVAAAAFGGLGPGLLATAGAELCVNLLFDPTPGRIDLYEPAALMRQALFLAGGIGISVVAGMNRARRARERLQAERLRKSEQRLRTFFESDMVGTIFATLDGLITDANDKFLQMVGYSREDLAAGHIDWMRMTPPEYWPLDEHAVAALRATGVAGPYEKEYIRKDGTRIPVILGSAMVDENRYEGVAFVLDISDRKRMEQALRESEQKFRNMAEHLQAALGIVQGQRFVYANPYFAQLSGYSIEEILTMDFPAMVHPSHQPMMIDRAIRRQRGEPLSNNFEFLMLTKSGEARWIDYSGATIEYHGRPAIIGVGFDITERKRAEEALRQSEARYRTLFELSPNGVALVAPDGTIAAFNQHIHQQLGYSAAEFGRLKVTDLEVQESPEVVKDHIGRMLREGMERFETKHRTKQGQVRDVAVSARPVEFDGKPYVLAVWRDITEQKRMEQELRTAKVSAERAMAAAEAANKAKDHFLAVLSHELRTPLTPVLAGVSMLEDDSHCDQRMREMLEMVRRNIELEARLIDDLLDMTRIARGKIELDKRPVELCSAITRAVEVCKADIEARRLHFGVDFGPCAGLVVEADVGRLQQVFWNLLKNAVKFTPHGGCVGIRCVQNGEGHVIIEVKDSGIGIEPEAMGRIFNAFEQAERSITRQFGGLGLGLAITKVLVELHGGTIEAQSEGKGKGAIFRVRLPVHVVVGARHPSPSVPRATGTDQQRAGHAPPLRILLVEDHGDTAKIMRQLLMMEGHDVKVAADVATALEAAGKYTFDLILSDLGLPDGSGVDLMRELRLRGCKLPSIALSGYGQEQDVQRSREAGFLAHLTKPVSLDRLGEVITSVVSAGNADRR